MNISISKIAKYIQTWGRVFNFDDETEEMKILYSVHFQMAHDSLLQLAQLNKIHEELAGIWFGIVKQLTEQYQCPLDFVKITESMCELSANFESDYNEFIFNTDGYRLPKDDFAVSYLNEKILPQIDIEKYKIELTIEA
jgi:hypothetical protein